MRFLADESCDFAVVRALRRVGHDVKAVTESKPRAPDDEVLTLAVREKRVLLTEDKDFGQLVYADQRATAGVVFLRFPAATRKQIAHDVLQLVRRSGQRLAGRFVVLQPGRVRLGRRAKRER
jgi:predicted nuclease of predicted toxin-antitoxin system